MYIAADGTFPLLHFLFLRFLVEFQGVKQILDGPDRDTWNCFDALKKCLGIAALREHEARLAA